MAIEIVDLPIDSMVIFHSYVMFTRGYLDEFLKDVKENRQAFKNLMTKKRQMCGLVEEPVPHFPFFWNALGFR